MPFRVGIDLGTTYCALAMIDPKTGNPVVIQNSEGEQTFPSAIFFKDGLYNAGLEAKERFEAGDVNCAVFFKRMMGEKEDGKDSVCFTAEKGTPHERNYTAVELSTMLLLYLKEEAETAVGDSISEAVITCPAYFYSNERDCILRAAASAGLRVKELLEEPAAAALAYGSRHWKAGARILVYDLGGGTFDVSVVEMDSNLTMHVIGTMGRKFLGGKDFDEALFRVVLRELASAADVDVNFISEEERSVIRGEIENTKKKLSDLQSVRVSGIVSGQKVSADITRSDFEQESADILEDTGTLINQLFVESNIERNSIVDVLLVGGSTLMPCVRNYLTSKFGKPPLTHANPATAVAVGAAIRTLKNSPDDVSRRPNTPTRKLEGTTSQSGGKISTESLGELTLRKTATHTMGVIAVSADGTKYINEPIITAGNTIPFKSAKTLRFATKADGSSVVDLYLLQGSKERPLANKIQKRYIASGLHHNQDGRTYIRVQYEYDNFGIINVRVRQEDAQVDLPIVAYDPPEDMEWTDYPPIRETIDEGNQHSSQPLSLLLFFDTSYSMHDGPIEDAQVAANKLANDLKENNPNATIGIGVVANSAKILLSPTNNINHILDSIRSVKEYVDDGKVGFGNDGHPFDEILSAMGSASGERIAVVLADGVWENQSTAVAASKRCNTAGIDTIGLGFGSADKQFLNNMSSREFEFSTFVQNSGELVELFGNLAQSLGTGNTNLPQAEVWD